MQQNVSSLPREQPLHPGRRWRASTVHSAALGTASGPFFCFSHTRARSLSLSLSLTGELEGQQPSGTIGLVTT